jgi:hypothetical protein
LNAFFDRGLIDEYFVDVFEGIMGGIIEMHVSYYLSLKSK